MFFLKPFLSIVHGLQMSDILNYRQIRIAV